MTKTRNSEIWKEDVAWCKETRTRMLGKIAFGNQFRDLPEVNDDKAQNWYPGLILVSSYSRNGQDRSSWIKIHDHLLLTSLSLLWLACERKREKEE